MAEPIKKLEKVYCSLNLGFIYNISYNFSPQDGSTITIFFVNETGDYDKSFLSTINPVSIKIGKAQFQMYAISYEENMDNSRKVIGVTFIDNTFLLNNYYIVLGKRGCGQNVHSLGTPVLDEVNNQILTVRERQIRDLTQLFDLEYSFLDFINVLQTVFPVALAVPIDSTVKRDFTGSFKEVLNAWCSYLDYFYFFQDGVIQIYAAANFSLTFPDIPTEALSFSRKESLANTYSKTASLYYEDEGGEQAIDSMVDAGGAASKDAKGNGAGADSNSNNYITYISLSPYNGPLAFGDFEQLSPEPNFQQCAAASYGIEFWFLYNYYNAIGAIDIDIKDTNNNITTKGKYFPEIGLTTVSNFAANADLASYSNTIDALGGNGFSLINSEVINNNFEKYKNYGQKVAGRLYMTTAQWNLDYYDQFTFVVANQLFELDDGGQLIDQSNYKLQQFTTQEGQIGILPDTSVNGFEGLTADGNRMVYFDNYTVDFDAMFALSDSRKSSLKQVYDALVIGVPSSNNIPNSFMGGGDWVVYKDTFLSDNSVGSFINETLQDFLLNPSAMVPRYPNAIDFVGYSKINNLNFNSTQGTVDGKDKTTIKKKGATGSQTNTTPNSSVNNPRQNTASNVRVSSNDSITTTTTIGGINNNQAIQPYAFYAKLQKCSSMTQGFGNNVLGHRFQAKQISVDTPLRVVTNKQGNSYTITRDTSYIDDTRWQEVLRLISQPNTFTEQSISFSTNFFYEVPEKFLLNGLTSLSLEVSADGLTANYTFSNAMMFIREYEAEEAKIERAIKQSYIRKYNNWSRFNNKG